MPVIMNQTMEIADQASPMGLWADMQADMPPGVVISGWCGGPAAAAADGSHLGEQEAALWLGELVARERMWAQMDATTT